MKLPEKILVGICGLILGIVIVQALFPAKYVSAPPPPATPVVACVGTPIPVDFPFTGAVNEPWTCQVQCTDGKPRFILYSNGKGTQCETPPGCNDIGEDNNITCTPPTKSTK